MTHHMHILNRVDIASSRCILKSFSYGFPGDAGTITTLNNEETSELSNFSPIKEKSSGYYKFYRYYMLQTNVAHDRVVMPRVSCDPTTCEYLTCRVHK